MAVTFKLYASDGSSLIHTFSTVFSANYPQSGKNIVEHISPRGKGSLIMDTGDAAFDLILKGVLFASDYNTLMTLVDDMETDIALNTKFVIKITKGTSTTWDYNCKRINPIIWQEDNLRTNYIEYQVILRCNVW